MMSHIVHFGVWPFITKSPALQCYMSGQPVEKNVMENSQKRNTNQYQRLREACRRTKEFCRMWQLHYKGSLSFHYWNIFERIHNKPRKFIWLPTQL